MSSPDDILNDRAYIKYKAIVRKWEKTFFKEKGRIPSKYDIKEAAIEVRKAYSKYYQMKSQVLEGALDQVELASPPSSPVLPPPSPFSAASQSPPPSIELPSTSEIHKLMTTPPQNQISNRVWGKHLNKSENPKPAKKTLSITPKLSQNLLKNCSFSKRNPRISLSSKLNKSSSLNDSLLNISMDNSQTPTSLTTTISTSSSRISTEIENRNSNTPKKTENSTKDLPHNDVMELEENILNISHDKNVNVTTNLESTLIVNPIQSVNFNKIIPRNINVDWVDRCSSIKDNNDAPKTNEEVIDNKNNQYGLRNLNANIIGKIDFTDMSNVDYIENSESEDERTLNGSQLKRIKLIIKKPKFELNSSKSSIMDSSCEEKSSLINTKIIKKTTKAKSQNKKKVVKKKSKKTMKKENSLDPKEEENILDVLNDEKVDMPRFAIDSSILKEKNLIDGLATTIKLPRKSKNKNNVSRDIRSKESELTKKIEDGTLNENFVRINIEKKVYVRGKKSINYSKFKKQQWKNKKKALNELGPEFPDGGLLKCFKCDGIGHMARYCQAHKGGGLLPLEHIEDESSKHLTLEEMKNSQNKLDENMGEDIVFETLTKDIDWNEEIHQNEENTKKVENNFNPQTYLRFLPNITNEVTSDKIKPLYSLNDGKLLDTTNEVKNALKLFGHTAFRSGQEIAIMRILSGLSTVVTLSTGSGKSLCYQLPAYIYAQHNKCITLVISPLVSLMEDQVMNMPEFLRAGCLHTNQTNTQREKIMEIIKSGGIDILLVSPEAIVSGERSNGFGGLLRHLPPIAFACIDEIHCVSQWSHNFRPSYLMICRVLREKMGVNCILGLTATATKTSVDSIIKHLNISDGLGGVITNLPLPDNLVLTVSRDLRKDQCLLELLQSERFSKCESVIIYCIRRDECERIATLIRTSLQNSNEYITYNANKVANRKRKRVDYFVDAYHAGMSAARRKRVQQNFMSGSLRIVVATVAFGMGINKADIRCVIHYNMPSSFESYVQEVGRAGRDGLPAQCHVFIDSEEKDKNELLRHIYANSIDRYVVRKLLQKVFIPCTCKDMNVENCQGHEVAFSVEDTVRELDIPAENISTLLCYLELHNNKYLKVLSNVYINCKISSYGGPSILMKAAQKCPPLAMAIALERNKGLNMDNLNTLEFPVVDVAAAIGWESGLVKYHLKNLEWEKYGERMKKSLLRIEFNTLGFRVKAPGDLDTTQLDMALDLLYERTQLQEKTMLSQLHTISKTLLDVSFETIYDCSSLDTESICKKKSDDMKAIVREYFTSKTDQLSKMEITKKSPNKNQIISDIGGLISAYKDCTFTSRAIARILQGISSPNYPAIIWGRCKYWRSHISEDFYSLCDIAKQQIMFLK